MWTITDKKLVVLLSSARELAAKSIQAAQKAVRQEGKTYLIQSCELGIGSFPTRIAREEQEALKTMA